mgnify:CR=1 FL=1
MFKKVILVAASTLFAVSAASASAQGPCPSQVGLEAGQNTFHAVCGVATPQNAITHQAPAQSQSAFQPTAGLQPKNSKHTLQPLRLS